MAEPDMPLDEFPLEEIGRLHGIAAALFVPFVIQRLSRSPDDRSREVDVELVNIGGVARAERRMRITWQAESVLHLRVGVQSRVVTEWAALGIAAAVVWQYTGLRVADVAKEGQGVDYWVTDGQQRFGLEVSGTLSGDLMARHRDKVRQLRDNASRADGYVVVVGFAGDRVIVSFHQYPEAKP